MIIEIARAHIKEHTAHFQNGEQTYNFLQNIPWHREIMTRGRKEADPSLVPG